MTGTVTLVTWLRCERAAGPRVGVTARVAAPVSSFSASLPTVTRVKVCQVAVPYLCCYDDKIITRGVASPTLDFTFSASVCEDGSVHIYGEWGNEQ